MELHDNILDSCRELKLSTTPEQYHTLGATAAKESWTYAKFLDEVYSTPISQDNFSKILIPS